MTFSFHPEAEEEFKAAIDYYEHRDAGMNDVVDIEYKGGFVFRIVFEDGESGDIDFSEYLGTGPGFEPLRDEVPVGHEHYYPR